MSSTPPLTMTYRRAGDPGTPLAGTRLTFHVKPAGGVGTLTVELADTGPFQSEATLEKESDQYDLKCSAPRIPGDSYEIVVAATDSAPTPNRVESRIEVLAGYPYAALVVPMTNRPRLLVNRLVWPRIHQTQYNFNDGGQSSYGQDTVATLNLRVNVTSRQILIHGDRDEIVDSQKNTHYWGQTFDAHVSISEMCDKLLPDLVFGTLHGHLTEHQTGLRNVIKRLKDQIPPVPV